LKSALLPLVILWLAAHAFLLGLILGVKFLGIKALLLVAMLGTALWFAIGRRPDLSAPRDMV
jgi:hypothetical protein